MNLSDFNRNFVYKSDSIDSWRNLTKTKDCAGDCDDYAWTVACIMEPNFFKRWLKILKGDFRFIRVYTDWGEPHLVFFSHRNGYIDNIEKHWMGGNPYTRREEASLTRILVKTVIGLFK